MYGEGRVISMVELWSMGEKGKMERYFEVNGGGHNVRCKLYCKDLRSVSRVVVFCHGFGGHKDNSAAEKLAQRLLSKFKDVGLITFNWPCHGDDVKKKLCLDDCMAYLDLVVSYARDTLGAELYCNATSFGGYLTLLYLTRRGNPFRKIVLRCPAVPMHEVLTNAIVDEKSLEALSKGREALVGFDRKVPVSPAFLEELEANDVREGDFLDWAEDILILHGTDDEIVPFGGAAAFSEEKLIDLIPVEGADHRFRHPGTMETAMKETVNFFGF